MSGAGMTPPPNTTHVAQVPLPQLLHHTGEQRQVRTREERQADGVDVLLERGLRDLLRRLVEARVDDLEAGVAQGPRDGLGPPVVAVEPRLGDHHAIGPFHQDADVTSVRWAAPTSTGHTDDVVEARLRSPVGRAVVPVAVGLAVIAVVFGLLWLIAIVVTHNANESNRRVGADVFEVGRVDRLSDSVARNGPILFPNLVGPAGERPVGLAHDGASDFEGWRVFSLRPAGRRAGLPRPGRSADQAARGLPGHRLRSGAAARRRTGRRAHRQGRHPEPGPATRHVGWVGAHGRHQGRGADG